MSTKRPFAELLTGLQQNKVPLTDLIQSLNERGPVQSPLHRAELAMLDEALAKKQLDERMHRLLTAKLKDVQNAKPAPAAAPKPAASMAGDKTVVAGGGRAEDKTTVNRGAAADDRTALNPAGGDGADERTALNPSGGGDGGFDLLLPNAGDADKTQAGQASAETTGFKPSEPVTGSRTTGGKSGPSTSSWQRVAAKAATEPEREVHAGDVLKDRFFLDKEVGRGGMGIVFKARDERKVEAQDKNPWVAVKVLNPEFRKHPQALVALQRESRKAQQLTHDNILRVYDFDKDGTIIYMTMEYVDGGSLKDVIKKHPSGMAFDKGWPIIAGLAHGLGRAHRDNIVHSDFKPGNVMMTSDMIPKLFDLGIARAAQSGATAKGETTVFDAGELGALTPAYASLEMIQGQPPELIDDIYALGITAYEILLGKHPYGKKNAEQAMKEHLKLPVVPGLTRRQRKTLEASLAFARAERIKTCDAFIDGLRPRTWKEVALPIGTAVAGTLLVLVLIFGPGRTWLQNQRIAGLIERFQQAQFADTAEALKTFEGMNESERELAKQRGSAPIQDYFFKVANEKWDLAAKPPQYDYPDALAVVNSAKTLFPDSARVAENLRRLDDEKKNLLSKLNDEFNGHIDAGRIYEDKEPNVVQTVAIVRRVDPNNDLLKDAKLLGRYTTDVRNALEGGNYEVAEKRAATSVKVFPKTDTLLALQTSVKQAREMQVASLKERELREKMTAAQAKEQLATLAANPLFTPDWQVNVNVAMSKLTADTTPETQQVKVSLAGAYAKQLATKLDGKELVAAQLVADTGMKLFPGAPNLMQEVNRLTQARKAQEAEEAAKAAVAEVDTLKRTLRTKADANDIRGAQTALDKLRASLPSNDPFLSGDGPKALGEAYLRQAEKQAEQGRYAQAQKFVADGLKVAPALEGLKLAEKKFKIDGSIAALTAGAEQPGNANGEQLKAALDVLRAEDPTRFDKLSGQFQNTALSRIQALTNTDPAAAGKGKAEWLKVYPQYQQLASLVIPTGVAAPATTTPGLPTEAKKARRAPGVDTCSASFAGFGRSGKATCLDDVAGAPGPKLVVVPGVGGGAAFAITKYEITVGQFDAFCKATGKCRPAGGNDALPRTNISLSVAKAYAAWLTETTGFTYRVPTDAEWAHAAGAGGQGLGEDFQCIQMVGSSQVRGGNAIPVATGKPNPWGLINAIGNAAELVDGGSARGGHFNTPTSQCTVEWRQGGSESDTIGVRLVREMG